MNLVPAIAVFVGAGLGALLRWALGNALNHAFPALPPGTLAANVIGGLLMGVALVVFAPNETLSPVARLAFTTGFLGGLTTFSAFSGESAELLLRGELRWAALHTLAHVVLSLLAVFAGIAGARGVFRLVGAAP